MDDNATLIMINMPILGIYSKMRYFEKPVKLQIVINYLKSRDPDVK